MYCRKSFILVVVVAAALGSGGCSRGTAEAPAVAAPPMEPDLVTLDPDSLREGQIQWETLQMSTLPEVLSVTGRVGTNENRTSRVGSIVDGRVVEVNANVGDRVQQGAVLVRIHSHEVHDARAEYATALAEMSRRRAELQFARNSHDRASRLYELKAMSQEQLQRAEADLSEAELGVTVAQAEINRVEEHLHHLGISPAGAVEEYTSARAPGEFEEDELVPVVAPISGTVLQRMVSPGMVVTPSNDLMVLSDLGILWVNAEVPERNLAVIKTGRPVKITVQAYGDTVFPGTIALIGDTLNPETRTATVRCLAPNRDGRLKPEMYATITFEIGEVRPALLVAGSSLQDINGQSMVFVREGESRFRARPIHIGRLMGDRTEVVEGLKPGETIVTAGSFLLKSELLKRKFAVE